MTEWTLERIFKLAEDDKDGVMSIRRANGCKVFVCASMDASEHFEKELNRYRQTKNENT